MHRDEPPKLARVGRLALHQDTPGEGGRTGGEYVVERIAEQVEGPRNLLELELAAAHAHGAEREPVHDATQARVGGERAEKRPRADELRRAGDVVLRPIEQGMTIEEFAAA